MFRRLLLVGALLACGSTRVFAQGTDGPTTISAQDAGACATANACATFDLSPTTPSVGLEITGAMSATLTFEATGDGTTWRIVRAVRPDGFATTTTTAAGLFTINNAGYTKVRVRAGTWASGSPTVYRRVGAGPGAPPRAGAVPLQVRSNPAVSTQATASAAAVTGYRHVADCVSFSAASTTAPALTALTVNLRDGATGAGTVIWSQQVVISASTGQNVAPFAVCGLHLTGTAATAMTLEFSALLTNLIQSVSLTYYDVP